MAINTRARTAVAPRYPSFIKPGGGRTANYFNVKPGKWYEGEVTAVAAFREMLDAVNSADIHAVPMFPLVRELAKALGEPSGRASRHMAAFHFVCCLNDAIEIVARHFDYGPWLDAKMREAERLRRVGAKFDASEAAAFSARMKAAREAKRQARLMAGSTTSGRA